jgi:hypothetical protein
MRQLGPIVGIPTGVVRSVKPQFTVGHRIVPQLVRHDCPRRAVIPGQQVLEETRCGVCISALLQQYINNFAVLVDGSLQVPLPASDSNEDLINKKKVSS